MNIRLIESIAGFEAVRGAWRAVHARDPASSIFSSWEWFRGWLAETPDPWKILALQGPEGEYRAFFPLVFRGRVRRGVRIGEIFIGGHPSSDHTGFVCLPGDQDAVARALAKGLARQRDWTVLHLKDAFDPKVQLLAGAFPRHRFVLRQEKGQPCPYLSLPGSWERYLEDLPSRDWRKKFRRYMREFKSGADFRVVFPDRAGFAEQLEVFMDLFRRRWPQVPPDSLAMKRALLRSCFDGEALLLPVLRYRGRPIATQAVYVDRKNATLAFYNGGWDPAHARLRPGNRLNCYLVHHAIVNGYRCLDFLRGGEAYKQETFGARIRYNRNFRVERRGPKRCWDRGLDLAGQAAGPGRQFWRALVPADLDAQQERTPP